MDAFFQGAAVYLLVNAFLCLYRAYRGPHVVDRILAVNVVGAKTLVVLVLLAFVFHRGFFIDVAFVYALLNFVITVAASRFLETGRLKEAASWFRDTGEVTRLSFDMGIPCRRCRWAGSAISWGFES